MRAQGLRFKDDMSSQDARAHAGPGPSQQAPPRGSGGPPQPAGPQGGWGTPLGCPAPYLGVHAEEVVWSPAAQRRALKRLAVVKVVVVFQAPNLQKQRFVVVLFFK